MSSSAAMVGRSRMRSNEPRSPNMLRPKDTTCPR
jgi:hypothetical protein